MNGLFDRVPHADTSEFDRSAIRAACGEHVQAPVFAALPVEVADALRKP